MNNETFLTGHNGLLVGLDAEDLLNHFDGDLCSITLTKEEADEIIRLLLGKIQIKKNLPKDKAVFPVWEAWDLDNFHTVAEILEKAGERSEHYGYTLYGIDRRGIHPSEHHDFWYIDPEPWSSTPNGTCDDYTIIIDIFQPYEMICFKSLSEMNEFSSQRNLGWSY